MPEVKQEVTEKTSIQAGDTYQTAKSASGSVSKHSGDPVALVLVGLTLGETFEIAAECLDTTTAELEAKYGHLNEGMQRMNLGNRIRGVVNKIDRNNEKAAAKKEEVGPSGIDYLTEVASPFRQAADERAEVEAKLKAEKEAEAKAKAEAKEKAKAEKEAKAAEESADEAEG